jgi:hypothetical protein
MAGQLVAIGCVFLNFADAVRLPAGRAEPYFRLDQNARDSDHSLTTTG